VNANYALTLYFFACAAELNDKNSGIQVELLILLVRKENQRKIFLVPGKTNYI